MSDARQLATKADGHAAAAARVRAMAERMGRELFAAVELESELSPDAARLVTAEAMALGNLGGELACEHDLQASTARGWRLAATLKEAADGRAPRPAVARVERAAGQRRPPVFGVLMGLGQGVASGGDSR